MNDEFFSDPIIEIKTSGDRSSDARERFNFWVYIQIYYKIYPDKTDFKS